MPVICKDCTHFIPQSYDFDMEVAECNSEKAKGINIITGKEVKRTCKSMRDGTCGKNGSLFEAKVSSSSFKKKNWYNKFAFWR